MNLKPSWKFQIERKVKITWDIILIFSYSLLRASPNPGGGQSATANSSNIGQGQKGREKFKSPVKLRPGYQSPTKSPTSQGRQSPRLYQDSNIRIDPTQSPIKLRFNKNRSPLCERTASGICERQSCNSTITNNHRLSPKNSPKPLRTQVPPQKDNLLPKGTGLGVRQPCKGAAGCCREACCRLPGNENKVCDPLCPFHKEKSAGLVFCWHNYAVIDFENHAAWPAVANAL